MIICMIIAFVYGIVIGSFLNVCIIRIPNNESIVKVRSHCMKCGYNLKWYDMIPLFSYILLRGRCRKCGEKISIQYPLIEGLNGVIYMIVFYVNGISIMSGIYCLMISALIVISMIDFRTFEIPFGINIFITVLGLITIGLDYKNYLEHIIGFFAVSVFIYLIYYFSNGRAFGGGDVKLMAACGLVVGYKLVILSFFIACLLGSVIHIARMKLTSEDNHMLAMGPYLSAGIFISLLCGMNIINWYIGFFI